MPEQERNIIEAEEKTYLIDDKHKPISVCAYCRVSTDKDDQKNSFEAQRSFFEFTFEKHENWYEKRIFADEGISGTSLKKRYEFNKMIALAKKGYYQLIITKEVSRFSRNVQDILNIATELRSLGVYIYFLTDEINTESDDYREQLIKAADQAEAESRKTSKRVKWGQRRQMEQGVIFGRKEMYGYNIIRTADGKQKLEIIPEEAEIVRKIFTMYASGLGTFKIAKKLEREGVKTKRYKNGWSNTVILRILRNEKYVGDLVTGKTYTPDYLTHEKKYNRNKESPKVEFKNHHPESAIIDRELWDKVQRLLLENAPTNEAKEKHSNRYWCSGKVVCGECGQRYVSHTKKLKSGDTYKSWKCWESQQHGSKKELVLDTGEKIEVGCDSQCVNEKVLKQAMYDIVQALKPKIDDTIASLETDFKKRKDNNVSDVSKRLDKLQKQADEISETITNLAILYAEGKMDELAYKPAHKKKSDELQNINNEISELSKLDNQHYELDVEFARQCERLRKIVNLEDEGFNEDIYRSILDKIEVYNNHILKFYLFNLLTITMEYTTSGKLNNYKAIFTIKAVEQRAL